ncbi:galactose oxidase [Mycena amicta]|nr:galactose oxidase [Mycena amicta]
MSRLRLLCVHSFLLFFSPGPERNQGASTTIFGSKIVLFGGCVPSSSTVMSDLYVLDVELCKWEKLLPPAHTPALRGRCFHTADIWNNHLVVFGGLSVITSNASERLQDLNQVNLLDLSTSRWLPTKAGKSTSTIPPPPARHNHISCVSANHLVVLGGVDGWGERLEDICVYDLERQEWVRTQRYSCPLDVDRAFCATSRWRVCTPPLSPPYASSPEESFALAPPEPLPYSEAASLESPSELYLFNSAADNQQPPTGPNGAILGTTLVLSGNSPPVVGASPSFTVWTLDLTNHLWTRIDTGDLVKTGVWSSGHLWNPHNKFLVLGTKRPCSPSTVTELPNHYDTVAFVDLEALGIYQAPARSLDPAHQRRALSILAGRPACRLCLCLLRRPGDPLRTGPRRWALALATRPARPPPCIDADPRAQRRKTHPDNRQRDEMHNRGVLPRSAGAAAGTALQRAPAVLSHLLLIATEFRISYLQALVKHALHLALSEETAAGVYEVAASCGCRSLQIR